MIKSKYIIYVSLIIILLSAFNLNNRVLGNTSNGIKVDDTFKEKNIGLNIKYLEDKKHEITIEEILSGKYSDNFIPSKKRNPGFGYTDSAYWFKNECIK